MIHRQNFRLLATVYFLAGIVGITGCNVHVNKESSGGGDKNVSISTPFGGLRVRTDDVAAKDTGLKPYPGARLKPDQEHDQGKANVNIDTPWFSLKVVALTYQTDDARDKVWDFYKKDMSQYGRVLECKPGSPDMKLEKKDKQDLTCDKANIHGEDVHMSSSDMELRVGTGERMRIVGFKPTNTGTEFSLVYVVTRGGRESL